MRHATQTTTPLSEWPNGDLFMIESKLMWSQRWPQADGSLGLPTGAQLKGLAAEAPNYCAWFVALVAGIREEMEHLLGQDSPTEQSEPAMVPDFSRWYDKEIMNLHEQAQAWHPKNLGEPRFRQSSEDIARVFPVYWDWYNTVLSQIREILEERGIPAHMTNRGVQIRRTRLTVIEGEAS